MTVETNPAEAFRDDGNFGWQSGRVATIATLATVVSVLPIFLLGGLASLVRRDLGFDEAVLGLITSSFFAACAVFSTAAGSLADRIGSRRAVPFALGLSIIALLGIATVARSWAALAGFMLVGGAGNALMQPAANLALARGVRVRRQGVAFGAKQAAIPVATLVAGLAVPVVGLTVGWRWAFGVLALAALPLAPVAARGLAPEPKPVRTRRRRGSNRPHRGDHRPRGLLAVAVAGGCGAAAANSLGAFTVESVAAAGQPLARAGLLLSLGSVFAILTRVFVGWYADRSMVDQFRVLASMMIVGSFAMFALGGVTAIGVLTIAVIAAFGAGWGWPGLMHFAVVREHRERPAAAIGISQTGVYIGGIVGPVSFGWLVRTSGYRTAWTVAAIVLLLGGTLLHLHRWLASR
ncbi:MFS transporter [Egicoccus halophilus]|uniref:Major facilitator superfamily (MFS) profile domain-containing protein n=1 Tax=Egicoccus halophilus TaxID=1670830 RepID=A0A8J3EQK1_9ACTN|nr:MFS transporter [Egicoccus halophilus]GGI02469.1 hypothetical protein GCM10011354_00460 [Egicoccus halophilus]